MEYVKFFLDKSYGDYLSKNATNIEMCILGNFLTSDVQCNPLSFKEWGINAEWNDEIHGNITALKKYENYILLRDLFSEEEVPTMLKITCKQYEQILTDWEKKVLKLKPKEVIIKYENDQFIIETKN